MTFADSTYSGLYV